MLTCYIGTSGWSYEHWDKRFYPEKQPKTRWFQYYASKFNSVEVNATFYRSFKDKTFHKWYHQAPGKFKYIFKVPQLITHRKYLKNIEEQARRFCDSISLMEDKLGLALMQLAPKTGYDPELLKNAIRAFDDPSILAVEFRNDSWIREETVRLLKDEGAIFCNTDSPKQEFKEWYTSGKAYFRLHGKNDWYRYDYSDNELDNLVKMIEKFGQQGGKEAYVFFNNDFEAHAPYNALKVMEKLNKSKAGIVIPLFDEKKP